MATFASTPAAVAYDQAASQPLGALCSGIGYDPNTNTTTTVSNTYIGGATETIGFGRGVLSTTAPKVLKRK